MSCYSSPDMVNWTFEGIVLPAVPDDPESGLHPSKVIERPKVIYNTKTGKFVMWVHAESADYGKVYQLYSSENNQTLYISELTDDYLRPAGRFTRNFIGKWREAPAVFKHNGKYYIISSGCTGWDPNQAELAVADSIMGPWTVIGNPCTGSDADKTFYAQSTYVQPVMGKKDAYVAMFDRWNKKDLENSSYVWLPVEFNGENVTIPWRDKWTFDLFDNK